MKKFLIDFVNLKFGLKTKINSYATILPRLYTLSPRAMQEKRPML